MTNAAATTLANAIRTQTGLGVRVWEKGDHCRVYVTCPNLNANAHGENGRSLYLDMTKPMLPRKDDSGFVGARTRDRYSDAFDKALEIRDAFRATVAIVEAFA